MPSVKIPNGSGGWIKIPTVKGDTGNGIASVVLTSGNHAPGTTDTYTITFTDSTTTTFTVYNGTNGTGSLTSVTAGTGLSGGVITTSGTIAVNYGTTSTTSCVGNDSRLSDARTPVSHAHGNIANDGKIGSTADLPVFTTTAGAVTTKTIADAKTLLGIVVGAKVETTTYSGTDTYGVGNPKSIVFTGTPYLVFIRGGFYGDVGIFLPQTLTTSYADRGYKYLSNTSIQTSNCFAQKSADGKTLYWYNATGGAEYQFNSTGYTYTVTAITL